MNLPAAALILAVVTAAPACAADPGASAPSSFGVDGREPVLSVQGIGAQIYQCVAKADGTRAWAFREPIAALLQDGRTVGRHYAGPTWDVGDGGITGKPSASAPGATADDVPLLRLDVTARHGVGGLLAGVTTVLRLRTVGGVLAGACDLAGALRSVPYRADYVFLK